ncbi:MAG: WD40 repeat domain-containing protein [Pirellulaceae bacterium]
MPQNNDESELLSRVIDTDDPMPLLDNAVGAMALTPDEVELLTSWIAGGALDLIASTNAAMDWQAIPETLSPIYALDSRAMVNFWRWGMAIPCSWYDPSVARRVPRLSSFIDINLHLPDGTPLAATHLDLVQSLAFSPDSQTLATGGFRSVKLWRRQTAERQLLSGLATSDALSSFSTSARLAVVARKELVLSWST